MREEYEARRKRETLWRAQEGVKEEVEGGTERGGTLGEDLFLDYVTTEVGMSALHMLPCKLLSRRPVKNTAVYQTPTERHLKYNTV